MDDLTKDLASLRLADEPRSRRGRVVAFVLPVFVAVAGALFWLGATIQASTEVDVTTPRIERASEMSSGNPLLTASGYIVARRKAVVSAKIQGRLAELNVAEGSQVQKGQIIARIESQDDYDAQVRRAHAAVQQAEAQIAAGRAAIRRAAADLAEARRQTAVNERLVMARILPTDTFEANRARVKVLEAILGQAEAELTRLEAARAQTQADQQFFEAQRANTVIRAPFSGVVLKKMAEVGESVAPIPPGVTLSTSSGAIVALADLATLEVEVDVAEANVAKLTMPQPAEVTVEAFPDKRYRAELRQVSPTADRTKATVMVWVTILDRDPNLKPEMSAKATFFDSASSPAGNAAFAEPTIVVPAQAVVTRNGGSRVFQVIDGRAKLLAVSTGPARHDQIVITNGLGGTETIVLNPSAELNEGDKVAVRR
jgi:RND family efflux transporter MFP subunit